LTLSLESLDSLETANSKQESHLAPILFALTLTRIVVNCIRRFPYVILSPLAAALGVPTSTIEATLSLQVAIGVTSPFTGLYIDRIGRKRVMLAAIGGLTFFASIGAFGQTTNLILFVLVAGGACKILFDPAMQAYIGDRVPYARRGMAIGITELAWAGSLFIMGPLAAYLITQVSVGAIFGVIAVGGAITFVLLAALVPADASVIHRREDGQPGRLRVLFATRPAVAMLIFAVLASIAAEVMTIVYERWFREVFLLSTVTLGTLSAVISAAEVGGEGTVITLSDRFGKRRLLILTTLAAGIIYLILPHTAGNLSLAVVVFFLMFLAFEISIVTSIPLATEVLPQARGTMLSANVAAISIGRAVGTLLGGWMFRTAGYSLNGTVAMILNLIAVVLIWRFVFDHEHPGHHKNT
jgi:predicted MFS family arabinose efflux permease